MNLYIEEFLADFAICLLKNRIVLKMHIRAYTKSFLAFHIN